MTQIAFLPERGVISVSGADRVTFLNGLVSNEVSNAVPGQAVWAAMLSPQGRYLTDFFIFAEAERLLLDLPKSAAPEILKRLKRYVLRAAVVLDDLSEGSMVYAAWGGMPPFVPVTAPDPRLPEAGFRMISDHEVAANASLLNYDQHRIALGLPDGPPDLEIDKTLLLEAGFDELNGIAWDKGCYLGQELTARTKYRGLVKRRLVPVRAASPDLAPGTMIEADGQEVGTLRKMAGQIGLAMLRLDALDKPLHVSGVKLTANLPAWLVRAP